MPGSDRHRQSNGETSRKPGPRQRVSQRKRGQVTQQDSAAEQQESDHLRETLPGSGFSQAAFNHHTALLSDSRLSLPANARQQALIIRQLQREYGNQYVQRVVERVGRPAAENGQQPAAEPQQLPVVGNPTGGLRPGVGPDVEDQVVGGRTPGEFIGDVARPIGTGVGNAVGSIAALLTGISISSSTNSGPTWSNHGHFDWRVGFATTGTSGWIVQEIVNTYRAEDNTGNDVTPAHTPHYWEAWAVDAAGNVTPNVGADNDYWIRPSLGPNTQGHWSMEGSVYFTKTDPATQGFAAGNVPDAGILLSSTAAPAGLGVARLHRYAQGTWDSTGAAPTHTGSAGP